MELWLRTRHMAYYSNTWYLTSSYLKATQQKLDISGLQSMEPTQLDQHSTPFLPLQHPGLLHCKTFILGHDLWISYLLKNFCICSFIPINVNNKKRRLSFPSISFSPVLFPVTLTLPATTILIRMTIFFVTISSKCRFGEIWLLSSISYKSFIWVPWNTLEPAPRRYIRIASTECMMSFSTFFI